MRRSRSTVINLALILMQVLAPWVHAHTGGETMGFLHVPGLERLAYGATAVTDGAVAHPPDIILGVPAGVQTGGNRLGGTGDPAQAWLPPGLHRIPGPSAGLCVAIAIPTPLILRHHFRSGSPPRASPASFVAARPSRD
jgi:hypothetical protein